MRKLILTSFAICLGLVLCGGARAQTPAVPAAPATPPIYGAPITLEQAKKAAVAAEAEANKSNLKLTFAIVDPSGTLVYLQKGDGSINASSDVAIGKARTAARYRRPSKDFFDMMESGHSYAATLDPTLVASAGGVPIVVDGKVIGAIGSSGAPTGLIDLAAATAGAAALK
jgi:glc operon protein GlcG